MADEDQNSSAVDAGGGLSFGITLYLFRMLCDNPWNGGAGYTPKQVSAMTPDQFYFRLCETAALKNKQGRQVGTEPMAVLAMADKDGNIKGRDKDGNIITAKMRVGGESLCKRLNREYEEEQVKKQLTPYEIRAAGRAERRLKRAEKKKGSNGN